MNLIIILKKLLGLPHKETDPIGFEKYQTELKFRGLD